MIHIPVLQKEVFEYLNPKSNENFIDCTVGHGGHAKRILEKTGPEGKVLGIDQDSEQIKICESETKDFKERIILINNSYINLKEIIRNNNFGPIDGILLDLGMSSWHLEESGRGFAFMKNEPLDMRYQTETPNPKPQILNSNGLTAEEIVNRWPEKDIEEIIKEYGEERFASRIAKEITWARRKVPIKTTFQLVEVIKKAVPRGYEKGRIHFATRTFQALRIAVNQELENLENVLPQAIEVLKPQGKLAVISFHSLEDRIVKNFFRDQSKEGAIKILTKKPITASSEEIKSNYRSRSAKLRAIIKT